MTSPRLQEQFAEDVVLLARREADRGARRHAGDRRHEEARLEPESIDGQRVTAGGGRQDGARRQGRQGDRRLITGTAAPAVGISGEDGRCCRAEEARRTRPATTWTWASSARSRKSTPRSSTCSPRPTSRSLPPSASTRRARRTTSTPTRWPASHARTPRSSSTSPTWTDQLGEDVTPISECDLAYIGALQASAAAGWCPRSRPLPQGAGGRRGQRPHRRPRRACRAARRSVTDAGCRHRGGP